MERREFTCLGENPGEDALAVADMNHDENRGRKLAWECRDQFEQRMDAARRRADNDY
jgi:hypothetical protein